MIALVGVVSMIGLPIALIGFLVQFARRKESKKMWGIVTLVFLLLFVVSFALTPTPDSSESEETQQVSEEETQESSETETESETSTVAESETKEETAAEVFARENDISVELAESIEYALGQTGYTLASAYEMKQIDDWAEGQRYTIYVSQQYVWVFYVKDDEVQSIRQQKGLEFIYQKE